MSEAGVGQEIFNMEDIVEDLYFILKIGTKWVENNETSLCHFFKLRFLFKEGSNIFNFTGRSWASKFTNRSRVTFPGIIFGFFVTWCSGNERDKLGSKLSLIGSVRGGTVEKGCTFSYIDIFLNETTCHGTASA